MNKKLRDIRDGKPYAGDDENDVYDIEDIHLELDNTFRNENNLTEQFHGPTSKLPNKLKKLLKQDRKLKKNKQNKQIKCYHAIKK